MPDRRNVLITGAAARLGASLARAFATDGWRVFCHYDTSRDAAEKLTAELCASGGEAFALQASLSTESGCQELMAKVKRHVARLDCLVNNASSFAPDSATDFDPTKAAQQLQVNLLTPLSLSKWMAQELTPPASATPGCIVHILDQKIFNLNPDYFSYTVSKLSLERAVALQAQALAPALRVCGIAPGLMYLSGPQSQNNFDQASRINLMRRATDPAQVAATCVFLANNPCITGTTLAVDNGQHLVPLPRDVMFVVEDLLKTHT